jgi:DNA-binding protein Fis
MRAVDHALRAIRLAAARRATLVLRGEEDPVPLAYALHHRVLGPAAPFVVCDRRRRGDLPASVRSPANLNRAVEALQAAGGGSLCVRNCRPPRDFSELLRLLDETDHRVQLIVCIGSNERGRPLGCSTPIEVPPLRVRETELPRIIRAYAEEALATLHASSSCFSDRDHDWVLAYRATSLSEIEKATLRVVALNKEGNLHRAARLLGIAAISLSRWLSRRGLAAGHVSQVGIQ